MTLVKAKELANQSVQELELMLNDACNELFKLRNTSRQDRTEKPHRIGHQRKNIARLKTVLSAKRKGQ